MAKLTAKKIFEYTLDDLEIYTYTETQINSNMYVVFAGKNAIIIDPLANDEVLDMMSEREITAVKILLTHEHYDHISGVNYYKEQIKSVVVCSQACAAAIPYARKNLSRYYHLVLQAYRGSPVIPESRTNGHTYSCTANVAFINEYEFIFHKYKIKIWSVGGHSKGSSIILIDNIAVFTGDNLIPGTKTVNNLPGGSEENYIKIIKPFLLSIERSITVFPGHGIPIVLKDILKAHPDYNN